MDDILIMAASKEEMQLARHTLSPCHKVYNSQQIKKNSTLVIPVNTVSGDSNQISDYHYDWLWYD